MQFRPRLTGAFGSPCVATTRPSLLPTRTEQPVPQKRQGALSHLISVALLLVIRLVAAAGVLTPAAAAVAAIALLFIKSLRLICEKHFSWLSTLLSDGEKCFSSAMGIRFISICLLLMRINQCSRQHSRHSINFGQPVNHQLFTG